MDLNKPANDTKTGAALAALVTALILLPLQGWFFMLAVGVLHGIAAAVPAIGYGATLLLMMGVDVVAFTAKKFRK
jgi:hypothetical protein